jgi:hypothetical protein
MDGNLEAKAIEAAGRAYRSAIAGGAIERVALDVACAAYRVAHPAMNEDIICKVVAKLVRTANEQSRDASIAVVVGA